MKTYTNVWLRRAAIFLALTLGALGMLKAQNFYTFESLPKSKGKHTITGHYREENGKFILSDIHFEGSIHMGQTPGQIEGVYDEDESSVTFRFNNIELPCRASNLNQKLYKILNDGGGSTWQQESEAKQKQQSKTQVSSVIIMLQLDCSQSLGSDFGKVKRAAIEFIQTLQQASTRGNIHLGIVAFASTGFIKKNQIPPTPLDNNSAARLIDFIGRLGQEYNTGIYQAVNVGYNIATDYYRARLSTTNDFNGLYMVTFTDGLDNASRINGVDRSKALEIVKQKLQAGFYGKRIESYVVGVKGNDIETKEAEYRFHQALQSLATNESYYYKSENIDAVQEAFQRIANNLVSRTQTLYCTTAVGNKGWLQWVLDCNDGAVSVSTPAPVQPASNQRPKSYWGIDLIFGGGASLQDEEAKERSLICVRGKMRYKELGADLEVGYMQYAGLSAYWQPSFIRNSKHDFSGYLGAHLDCGLFNVRVPGDNEGQDSSSHSTYIQEFGTDVQAIAGLEYSYKRFNTGLSLRYGYRKELFCLLHVGLRFDWNK